MPGAPGEATAGRRQIGDSGERDTLLEFLGRGDARAAGAQAMMRPVIRPVDGAVSVRWHRADLQAVQEA